MASVGLKNFYYAPLKDKKSATYTEAPAILAGAIEASFSMNLNEASLYYDDQLQEDVSKFKSATLTLGIDDDDDAVFGVILGQELNAEVEGEYTSNVSDTPLEVGFGQIVTKMKNGTNKYKVEFFPRVKFKPFKAGSKTTGDSLEFTTPSVEGTIMPLANGDWEVHKTFDDEESALAYLKSLFKLVQA